MAYARFLTYSDYLAIATEEHLKQIVREIPERFIQAEKRAEQNMKEYLDQYYEIEKVLHVGKSIRNYSPAISYPAKVHFVYDNHIYQTQTAINGYKKPTLKVSWVKVQDFSNQERISRARKYSQLVTYVVGDIVIFGTEYWECILPNGLDLGEVCIPGCKVWVEANITPWEPNMDWEIHDVCSFNGNFYDYLGGEGSDGTITPEEDNAWGLIGDYSLDLTYDYSEGAFDYVVAENTVFYPILNPNAEPIKPGENIVFDDPRNPNVVTHMTNIALYYMHQLISPTNISETRRWAYEDSMQWLYNASKFKINPQLPRKKDCEEGINKVDWALATFQKSYDPNENAWLI